MKSPPYSLTTKRQTPSETGQRRLLDLKQDTLIATVPSR